MKIKLSFLSFFAITFISYSQTPINDFNSVPLSEYAIVTSPTAIDQSVTGENLTWTFNTLSATGNTNTDTYAAPTATELTTYPGTTSVYTGTELPSTNQNKIFSKDIASEVSITGVLGTDLELNYNTDNALIGTFPLNYNYSNSDVVAGTFIYTTNNGTFTGTFDVAVDAYGTLIMNDVGGGTFNGNVTRLKITQNLSLSVTFFPNVATVTQITHNYYDTNGGLVFRTTNITIVSALLGINETSIVMENLLNNTLSVNEQNNVSNNLKIEKNPITDNLIILSSSNINNASVSIVDLTGKVVYQKNNISLSNRTSFPIYLSSGLYILNITNAENFNFKTKLIVK